MASRQDHYIIRGGVEGRERLRVLSRVLRPTTRALLERAGLQRGMRCLDVGCGGGDVTLDMARIVGTEGLAVGVDMDATKIELARQEAAAQGIRAVEFRESDVASLTANVGEEALDVVYARFLLCHLPDPLGALTAFRTLLAPGGRLVIEDIDSSGSFSEPPSVAFERYVALYRQASRRRGVDPDIGRRLPALLKARGLVNVDQAVVQPIALAGDVKGVVLLTMESIAASVVAEGLATEAEVGDLLADLETDVANPDVLMSFPRIVQVWGVRPPT